MKKQNQFFSLRGVSSSLPRLVSLTCVALLLSPLLTLAQNDKQVWVQRFGTAAGPSRDVAYSIATDSSGNVIVAGDSNEWELPPNGTGMLVIKFSGTGESLSTNRYDTGFNTDGHVAAVAVDGSGNVFVTGSWKITGLLPQYGYYGYVTLAFSSLGIPLWANRFPSPDGSTAAAIALDNSGNVFVTGQGRAQSGASVDFVTLNYSGAGVPLWTNRFDGTDGGDDLPVALAVDNAGNVVVTGQSRAPANPYYSDFKA